MNFDNFINDLQSDIDSQLSQFGLNVNSDNKKFCPECGTQVVADANFCPDCGYNFNSESEVSIDPDNETHEESDVKEGIIWTDTRVLAAKYKTTRNAVQSIIEGFISTNEDFDLCWHMLDMADRQYEVG
jgi:NADH pyrophosphatase NudC (nudix superfamily)